MFAKISLFKVFVLFLLVIGFLSAEMKTKGVAVGFGPGIVVGDCDFGRDNLKFQGNFFLKHKIGGLLEGQITGSLLGQLTRDDEKAYSTDINSVDYRLLFRLYNKAAVSPYVYGGFGALWYAVKEIPAVQYTTVNTEEEAWVPFAPVGGGVQIKMTERTSLDISGGYNFIFSDEVDKHETGNNDGYFSGSAGLVINLGGGNPDPDMDRLTNKEEKKLGTDNKNPDTDNDGIWDGEEVVVNKTNPLKADTDEDGIIDGDEVKKYKTNPLKQDTDEDGLTDYKEIVTYNTDPVNKDTDGDGLSDNDEILTHKTEPLKADGDGDGLDDGSEILEHKTNPNNFDSDNDELNDGDEINKYKSDPLLADTDGGSINDGAEVERGTDPLNKEDDIVLEVKKGAPIVLDGVVFKSGKSDITPESAEILEKAYQTLKAYPTMIIEIQGHSDNVGNRNYNIHISQKRADAVKAFLVNKGIDSYRIQAKGFGPDRPLTSNDTKEGRLTNRRIEFVRIK